MTETNEPLQPSTPIDLADTDQVTQLVRWWLRINNHDTSDANCDMLRRALRRYDGASEQREAILDWLDAHVIR